MFNYAIGFDADTKKCGLIVADLHTKQVIETYCVGINEIIKTVLPAIVERYKKQGQFLMARIEQPTLQTAIGVNAKQKSRVAFASGVYDSGRCCEVANIFKAECINLGLVYSTVKSSNRVRCDYNQAAKFDVEQLKRFAQNQHKKNKFLSKVSNQKAALLFPNMTIVNSETVDAALLIPEIL